MTGTRARQSGSPLLCATMALVVGSGVGAGATRASAQETALGAAPSPATGDMATSVADLSAWALALGDDSASTREDAIQRFVALEEEALPAIRGRIAMFGRRGLDSDESYRALNSFRHAVGSLSADDEVDIVPGVPVVLTTDRSPLTVAMAERVLLVRALSEMGTLDAVAPLADILATDPGAWRWEQKRVVWRMGPRALPLLIVTRNHPSAAARRWARWGIRELGMGEPGRAIQMEDMVVLARLLRAYGTVRDMDAMTVVVQFVTHERGEVREAARWSTERYGQNAVWQLRRAYRNLVGEAAPSEWSAERTRDALYAAHDERRLAPVRVDLEAGLAAFTAGDLDTMRAKFDDVLARAPELPRRAEMAPGYAALAARAVAADGYEDAGRFYRRAVRLGPSATESPAWQAQLAFLEAEARLHTGVADLHAYERVLTLDPTHVGAHRFVDEVTAGAVRADTSWLAPTRLLAAFAALALLLAIGFVVRRRPMWPASSEVVEPAHDLTLARQSADDTLPG